MENCLSFIKDNIQDQAYKTWFEPIKSVELTDNALYIQVPSKFFYEWLEEHYVKLLKVALTKELGKNAKLLYKIRMENTYGQTTVYGTITKCQQSSYETSRSGCSIQKFKPRTQKLL
jgi:chromosomal replication initiator protein